jgi:hypothetical protein
MSSAASKLATAVRTGLAELGDARLAEQTRAYLKSAFRAERYVAIGLAARTAPR